MRGVIGSRQFLGCAEVRRFGDVPRWVGYTAQTRGYDAARTGSRVCRGRERLPENYSQRLFRKRVVTDRVAKSY